MDTITDFSKKHPAATIVFLLYLGMLLISTAIWESLGDFNTGACLALVILTLIGMFLVGAVTNPVVRAVYGRRFWSGMKFFIKAAFLSAILAVLHSHMDTSVY